MVIGYGRARNLMRLRNWKMRVSTSGISVGKVTLFHPDQRTEHTMRLDSGRKLMRECVVSERPDIQTVILSYNRTEAEVEEKPKWVTCNRTKAEVKEEPKWFAVTRWSQEDAIAVAAEHGVTLSLEQATAWWKRNERRFQDLLVEAGNGILSSMDFGEGG